MADTFSIQAPATIGHLGPGFGVLGLALDLWSELEVELDPLERGNAEETIQIERRAEDGSVPLERHLDNRHDALLRGLQFGSRVLGTTLPNSLGLTLTTGFPHGVGLGSTTAEYALGIYAAEELAARTGKDKRNKDETTDDAATWFARRSRQLDLLVGLGGDPAHGAAALAGGLAAAVPMPDSEEDGPDAEAMPPQPSGVRRRFRLLRLPLDDRWHCALAIPEARHGTADVHRILPPTLPNLVTQRTVGRFAGLLEALAIGDGTLLRASVHDEIHVPARKSLVPGLAQALDAAIEAGADASTIAGHGPAIVAWLRDPERGESVAAAMRDAFAAAGVEAGTIVCPPQFAGVTTVEAVETPAAEAERPSDQPPSEPESTPDDVS